MSRGGPALRENLVHRAGDGFGIRDHEVDARAEQGRLAHPGQRGQRFDQVLGRVTGNVKNALAHHAGLQFEGRAQGDHPAPVNHGEPVAVFGLLHVVGGDKYRHAVSGHVVNEVPETPPVQGVHPAGRLVEEKHGRFVQHGAGHGKALFPASAEHARRALAPFAQTRHVESPVLARGEAPPG
ncbi:MAG: hypothetical protein BWX68_02918 [Verrucomicrobia bacterium ADurb.Bin063]|nr:MAG: hypothetical protein BWX68_02918 [Verrucomicrobia bacterium ADurb.Bin063]